MSQEDRAQHFEALDWEINNRPRKPAEVFEPDDPKYGPEFCADDSCAVEMPPERRAMGKHLCVDCQSLLERTRLRNR